MTRHVEIHPTSLSIFDVETIMRTLEVDKMGAVGARKGGAYFSLGEPRRNAMTRHVEIHLTSLSIFDV